MMDLSAIPRTAPAAIAPVGLFDFLCGRWSRFAVACGECGHQFLAVVSNPQRSPSACCPGCGHINVWFEPRPPAKPVAVVVPFRARLKAIMRGWDNGGDGTGGTAVAV